MATVEFKTEAFLTGTIKCWPWREAHVNAPVGANEPKTAATAEGTVTSGKVTFTGLTPGEKYVAGKTTAGVFEYIEFVAEPLTPSTEERTRALESELILENPTMFAGLTQVGNTGVAARSNWQEQPCTDGALAGSGESAAVPIRCKIGDVFTKAAIFVGNTAASTPTHQWVALYKGESEEANCTLIQQTTDATTTARAAKGVAEYTFSPAVTITEAMCPFKYIYAAYCMTGSTICTAATFAEQLPSGIRYRWNPSTQKSPIFESFTFGSAQGATAASPIASAASKAVHPVIVLF